MSNIYEINVILKCNWNCEYCSVKEKLGAKLDFNDIIYNIKKIPDNSHLIISGGEPGLLSKDKLQYIFNIIKNKNITLELNTNGLFIKKYPDFLNFFNKINLHFDFDNPIFGNYNYVVIITDQNYNTIEEKLKLYNIKYDLIPSTHYNLTKNKYTLNKSLNKYFKYMTKESIFKYISNTRYKINYLN